MNEPATATALSVLDEVPEATMTTAGPAPDDAAAQPPTSQAVDTEAPALPDASAAEPAPAPEPLVIHLAKNDAAAILEREGARRGAEQMLALVEDAARILAETPISTVRAQRDLANEKLQSAVLLEMARRGLSPDRYDARVSDTGVTFTPKAAIAPPATE